MGRPIPYPRGMSGREASARAYAKVVETGLIKKLRAAVYTTLYHHGPLTQKEVADQISKNWPEKYQERSVTSEFAKLDRLGLVRCIGDRTCSLTGNLVSLWDVTAKEEVEKLPDVQTKAEQIEQLQEAINTLTQYVPMLAFMARRYASGQVPKAAKIYNQIATELLALGITLKEDQGTVFADEGTQ